MLHQRVEVGAEGLNVQVALSARTVERSAHGIVKVSAEPEETWPALSMAQTRNRAVVFAGNASEVVRAGLRLLEEEEGKLANLKKAIQEGLDSGTAKNFDPKKHLAALKKRKKNG